MLSEDPERQRETEYPPGPLTGVQFSPDLTGKQLRIAGRHYLIEKEHERQGGEADSYEGKDLDANKKRVLIKKFYSFRSREPLFLNKLATFQRMERAGGHDYCVPWLGIDRIEKRIFEVYAYADGPTLHEWLIQKEFKLAPDAVREIVRQIAEGLHFLHQAQIVHRDLKPKNILVVNESPLTLQITDYGTATILDHEGVETEPPLTYSYVAPELRTGIHVIEPDLRAGDWWSLGRIVQQIVVETMHEGAEIFAGRARLVNKILNGSDPQYSPGMLQVRAPEEWMPLLQGLLVEDRVKRWGYTEVSAFLDRRSPPPPPIDPPNYTEKPPSTWEYRGVSYTVQEGARVLARAESWEDAKKYFLREAQGGLFHFVVSIYRDVILDGRIRNQLDIARELRQVNAKQKSGDSAVGDFFDDLAVAMALCQIADGGLPLTIKGVIADQSLVKTLAREQGGDIKVAALLGVDSFLNRLKNLEPDRAKLFADINAKAAALLKEAGNLLRDVPAESRFGSAVFWSIADDPTVREHLLQGCKGLDKQLKGKLSAMGVTRPVRALAYLLDASPDKEWKKAAYEKIFGRVNAIEECHALRTLRPYREFPPFWFGFQGKRIGGFLTILGATVLFCSIQSFKVAMVTALFAVPAMLGYCWTLESAIASFLKNQVADPQPIETMMADEKSMDAHFLQHWRTACGRSESRSAAQVSKAEIATCRNEIRTPFLWLQALYGMPSNLDRPRDALVKFGHFLQAGFCLALFSPVLAVVSKSGEDQLVARLALIASLGIGAGLLYWGPAGVRVKQHFSK